MRLKEFYKLLDEISSNRCSEVSLSDCHLGDKGAQALADALSSNHSVRKLSLVYTEISADGIKALCNLAASSSRILYIDFTGNFFGEEGKAAMTMLKKKRESVTLIGMGAGKSF